MRSEEWGAMAMRRLDFGCNSVLRGRGEKAVKSFEGLGKTSTCLRAAFIMIKGSNGKIKFYFNDVFVFFL